MMVFDICGVYMVHRTVMRGTQALHYEVHGSGAPIFMIHSYLCSCELWREQIERLSKSCQVIAMDIRGHGQSPPSEPHDLYDLVDDAIAVLDHAEVASAIWCGLSIGGMITMRAALRHPTRVRAMVLVDTDGQTEALSTILKHQALKLIVQTIGIKAVLTPIMALMFGRTTHQRNAELIKVWRERFLALHVPSMMETLKALDRRDGCLNELRKVTIPCLVIHGHEDRAIHRSRGKALADALPNSEWQLIIDAGHMTNLESPETFNKLLEAFLQKHEEV